MAQSTSGLESRRTWILQANPKTYDVDAALASIDCIEWRIPQQPYAFGVGDIVWIWRAGAESGIVGVGTVETPPRRHEPLPAELKFYREQPEPDENRSRIRVRAVKPVPKHEVIDVPGFAHHRIITAPMGTVFDVPAELAQGLIARFPHLADVPASPSEPPPLPKAFSWKGRSKAVQMLPGGSTEMPETLHKLLAMVAEQRPAREYFEGWMVHEYGISEKNAEFTTNQLERLSLIRKTEGALEIHAPGQRYLDTRDKQFFLVLMHSRIQLIGELLDFARQPRTDDELWRHCVDDWGMNWKTPAQTLRRRMWLESFGGLRSDDSSRYATTELGRSVLAEVELGGVPSTSVPAAAPTVPEPVEAPQEPSLPATPQANDIADRLAAASRNTADPSQFEKVTTEAFAFLGFDAAWRGGSGQTDVLLDAPIGEDTYRVIVDCKTTASGAISASQIDFETLSEHRTRHEAQYAALVGPEFKATRIMERADRHSVAVISVAELVSLLRQHESVPLSLRDYEELFMERSDDAVAELSERAAAAEATMDLAATVLTAFTQHEEQSSGGLSARDLMWILSREDSGEANPQEDEIAEVLNFLASRAVGALEKKEGRFVSAALARTTGRRLRALATAIEQVAQEALRAPE